jgi:membrane-associated phospholipid phosphatase
MYTFQLKIIEFIQQIRSPFADEIFKFLDLFDSRIFYFILIPMIWIGYNYKFGIKLFFIVMLSTIINEFLKNLFHQPRPYILDSSLAVIHISNKYGLPSGAAQSAVLIPLIFINYFKEKKWPIIWGANFFFWISLSRLYLGVHFLTDILAGWAIGFSLFLIYLYLFPLIEKVIKKYNPNYVILICQIPVILLFFIPNVERYVFILSSVMLGIFLSDRYNLFLKNPKNKKDFFIRTGFSVAGIFVISILTYLVRIKIQLFTINISPYLMGLWISILCSYLYKRFLSHI